MKGKTMKWPLSLWNTKEVRLMRVDGGGDWNNHNWRYRLRFKYWPDGTWITPEEYTNHFSAQFLATEIRIKYKEFSRV